MKNNYQLHHEKLEVYQAAIRFLAKSIKISKHFPRGCGEINDQLKRASLSIPLNISEGYAKTSSKEKRRYLDIARGSAHECGAIIDSANIMNIVTIEEYHECKKELFGIVCMLIKFSQSIK